MYSQNNEEEIILNYFGSFKGTLLSIGENDGKTFSNSLRPIELGWKAVLVEPSPEAFKKLKNLHNGNDNVACYSVAIGIINGKGILHESGPHLKDKSDISLLSTIKADEKNRWKNVDFNEVEVDVYDYKTFIGLAGVSKFDFITIDAEGLDLNILEQIDLSDVRLLCIEWNSVKETKDQILKYCSSFGMNTIIYENAENLIIAR